MTKYTLRDNQVQLVDSCMNFIEGGGKYGIAVAPTAFGKSLCIANLAKQLHTDVLCIQPSVELLDQNIAKYRSYGYDASVYSAGKGKKDIGDVTFATPISVAKNASAFKRFKYIIVDEAHLGTKVGGVLHKALKTINPTKVLGLTASPVFLQQTSFGPMLKMMNRTNKSSYKKIVHVAQIQDMVKGGYWSPITYETRHVNSDMLLYNSTGSDYTEGSLIAMYKENNTHENIVKEVQNLKDESRKSILIFVPTIEQAEELSAAIKGSKAVSSQTPKKERTKIINDFKSGDLQTVINVNILATGFDHPELDAIVTARPTTSLAMYYQQIGRGVRIHKQKKDCKVVDFSGNVVKFGHVEDINFEDVPNYGWGMFAGDRLISGVPLYENMVITKEELQKPKIKASDLNTKFDFGKYSGKTIEAVMYRDPMYLQWIMSDKFDPYDARGKRMKELVKLYVKATLI